MLTGPNKKSYIGYSNNPERRFKEHSKAKSLIGNAVRKYGKEGFILDILDVGSFLKEAHKLEQFYIEELGTLVPGGYNLDSGGRGGKICSEETIEKMRKSATGRIFKPETIEKFRKAKLGTTRSQETIQKLKNSNTGKKRSLESISKGIETRKRNGTYSGWKQSSESIVKRVETRKRNGTNKHTKASIEKIRKSKLGKKHPPGSHEKVGETRRRNKEEAENLVASAILVADC